MTGYYKYIGHSKKVYVGYIPYMDMYLMFNTKADYEVMFNAYAKMEGRIAK